MLRERECYADKTSDKAAEENSTCGIQYDFPKCHSHAHVREGLYNPMGWRQPHWFIEKNVQKIPQKYKSGEDNKYSVYYFERIFGGSLHYRPTSFRVAIDFVSKLYYTVCKKEVACATFRIACRTHIEK